MSEVALRFTEPAGAADGDVLVLGHSLGTSADLWRDALPVLQAQFRVLLWELPGHGGAAPAQGAFGITDLTDALVAHLDRLGIGVFHYAGVSIGGGVGLDLCLRHPARVSSATIISTGARVDSPPVLRARAATARAEGLDGFEETFRPRWFTPSAPREVVQRTFRTLRATDVESYALASEALAEFDVWDQVPRIAVPVLAVGGQHDQNVAMATSIESAERVRNGEAASIPDAAHCLVAQHPVAVAELITEFVSAHR